MNALWGVVTWNRSPCLHIVRQSRSGENTSRYSLCGKRIIRFSVLPGKACKKCQQLKRLVAQ